MSSLCVNIGFGLLTSLNSNLEQFHPGYTGFGKSDKHLCDDATLSRGCGGVGLEVYCGKSCEH